MFSLLLLLIVNCCLSCAFFSPTLVKITTKDNTVLPGVIVSDTYVLTRKSTATSESISELTFAEDDHWSSFKITVTKDGIASFTEHPEEDYLLISLKERLTFGVRIFPACLRKTSPEFPSIGHLVAREAFNLKWYFGEKLVQSRLMKISETESCPEYSMSDAEDKICISCFKNFQNAKSGEPLMYIQGANYLLGFSSEQQKNCDKEGDKGLHSGIFPVIEWIEGVIG